MMFDPVHLAMKSLARAIYFQHIRNALARATVLEPMDDKLRVHAPRRQIGELPQEISAIILIDRDMLNVGQPDTRFSQAVSDRLGWEAGPMLHTTKAFLLRRSDELTVTDESSRRVAMERIEAKNNHK
jgi:hypothetical protein